MSMQQTHVGARRTAAVRLTTGIALVTGCCILVAFSGGKSTALGQEPDTTAKQRPSSTPDLRTSSQDSDRKQLIRVAWKQFEQISGDKWRVHWSNKTGLPRVIYGGRAGPYPGNHEEAAHTFLTGHKTLFALENPTVALRLRGVRAMGADRERVEFQMQYRNLDVYHSTIIVVMDEHGQVISVTSTAWPVRDLDIAPTLSAEAIQNLVAKTVAPQPVTITKGAALVVFPEGKGRLAYLVYLTAGPGKTPFEYVLDAHTGAVIHSTKLFKDDKAQNASSPPDAKDGGRKGEAAPAGGVRRVDHGPVVPRRPRPPRGGAIDPCDREWQFNGPAGETTVTEKGTPPDPFEVEIDLAFSSFGIDEAGTQAAAIYGAGMKLLPCKEYTVRFDYDLSTWDSYSSFDGFWDVFAVSANSLRFYWNSASVLEIGDLFCTTNYLQNAVYPPGNTWMFGGDDWENGILCTASGSFEFTYEETDSAENPYLSVLLDTGLTGAVDAFYPSWGTFNIELLSETHVFDPNPYRGGGGAPTDMDDADEGVACGAYFDVTLTDFVGQPAADNFWYLKGTYVDTQESLEDPKPPAIPEPKWRNDTFPFTRSCPEFEAVMCYYHITQTMKYVESLGPAYNLNNRPIRVDPHGLGGTTFNAHYSPQPDFGEGYLAFGGMGSGDTVVDLAEDGDVILHEYAHALQDDHAPEVHFGNGGFGVGNETWAMGEGFGDYWACSAFALVAPDPPAFGEWASQIVTGMRRVDRTKHYPEDMGNGYHLDGEIWSATLWELYIAHGKVVADKIILSSHFVTPDDPTFADSAVALLAADSALFGNLHQESIITIYLDRGIFRKLDMASNDVNVPITVTESDVRGDGNGSTNFQRVYPYCRDLPPPPPGGTPCPGVNLEAPATSPSGASFIRWVVDGVDQPAGQRTVRITMDHTPADHLARALYDVGTEACCFPNGTCDDLAPGDCNAAGGVPQGAGTFCLGDFDGNGIDDACEPPEACCFIDGSCADLGTGDCASFGGAAQGPGTICLGDLDGNGIDDACEDAEACCFPDGSCANLGTGDCAFFGGAAQGPGSVCLGDGDGNGIDDACEAPEACCFPDGSCADIAPPLCALVGGVPQGAGTFCLGDFDGNGIDDACEPPEACCFPDGSCANLGPGACASAGGAAQGPGSACLGDGDGNGIDDACEAPEACCFPDGSCADIGPGLCVFVGGAPQGPGSFCLGDFDGNGIDDACEGPEACCFPDGSCANLGPGDCASAGGDAQGPGSVCLGDSDGNGIDDACETPEACCFPDGSCVTVGSPLCAFLGGASQGPGSFCRGDFDGNGVDDACEPLEACCLVSGACFAAGTGDCTFFGGASQGPASFCLGDGDGNGVDDACEVTPPETCCYPSPGGACGSVPGGTCVPSGGVVVAACLGDTNGNLIDDACETQETCCFPVPGGGCGPVGVATCVPSGGIVVAACLGDTNGNLIDDACETQETCCFPVPSGGCGPVAVATCVPSGGVVVAACLGDTNGDLIDDACEPQETCCFPVPGGGCGPVAVATCVPSGGTVVAACLGDTNGNLIDDACETEECQYNNGPPLDDFGAPASQYDDFLPEVFSAEAADDFLFSGLGTNRCLVNGARFWATHFNMPPGIVPNPAAQWTGVTVSVYENADPKGPAGNRNDDGTFTTGLVATRTVPMSNVGVNPISFACLGGAFEIDVTLTDPILLEKNHKYWIVFQPNMDRTDDPGGGPGYGQIAVLLSEETHEHPAQQIFPLAGLPNWIDTPGNEGTNGTCNALPPGSLKDIAFELFAVKSASALPPILPPAPHNAQKNRYISFDANNGAIPVAFQITLSDGRTCWIGEPCLRSDTNDVDPQWVAECVQSAAGDGSDMVRDWSSYTDPSTGNPVVHVRGCVVLPNETYDVRAIAVGGVSSAALTIGTVPDPEVGSWADIVGEFIGGSWTAPNSNTNFRDVNASIQSFQQLPTAPPVSWVDLVDIGGAEVPNYKINFNDVGAIIRGFLNVSYPGTVTDCVIPAASGGCP